MFKPGVFGETSMDERQQLAMKAAICARVRRDDRKESIGATVDAALITTTDELLGEREGGRRLQERAETRPEQAGGEMQELQRDYRAVMAFNRSDECSRLRMVIDAGQPVVELLYGEGWTLLEAAMAELLRRMVHDQTHDKRQALGDLVRVLSALLLESKERMEQVVGDGAFNSKAGEKRIARLLLEQGWTWPSRRARPRRRPCLSPGGLLLQRSRRSWRATAWYYEP